MTRSLERLLRPGSIAVVGGREAGRVIEQCHRIGFAGPIWPVHPERAEIGGLRCFRSIAELPAPPDATFVGVNRRLTIGTVAALAARGAGGAVCYASGFRESDDGQSLQAALVEAAGEMPIIGPNCYGLINYLDGVALWPDQHGGRRVESGVAIVTQSSNMAINITMQRRGLPIAYVATAGNQAQTGLSDIAAGLLADERVTAIGLHIEGLDDAARFAALASHAREQLKPIVACAIGRSEQARAATVSHTASLAGSEAVTDAFLRRLGIARVQSLPEFLEALKLLHVHGPLPGNALASMSCSGGEAALIADAAHGRTVRFRPLSDADVARVKATVNPLVAIANPLDYHTFSWGDEAAMAATFTAMMALRFDLSMLVLDFPRADRCEDADWDAAVNALDKASAATGGRAAVVATLPENLPENRAEALIAQGIAPLAGLDEALAAAEAAAFIGVAWAKPAPGKHLLVAPSGGAPRTLSEARSKRLLADYGLTLPDSRIARSVDEAVSQAEALGYPVALKALGLAHKSEVGAVRLGLADAPAVAEAAQALFGQSSELLIERMVADGVAELILGIVRSPPFGHVMTIGTGGVLVELMQDTCSLILPVTADEVREALLSLRLAPLLTGYRGRPAGDLDAALDAALALARLAEDNAGRLEEVDVNPLIVLPAGQGAVAVDALIRMREEQ